MAEYDYRWLIAQCKQESGLNSHAVSPVGAQGYCQFMPPTWVDCQLALGFVASAFDAEKNITCAAWYMGGRVSVWSGRGRTPIQRLPLAQASYNCGTGCVLKAQARCNNGWLIEEIDPCLPEETRKYTKYIERYYIELRRP